MLSGKCSVIRLANPFGSDFRLHRKILYGTHVTKNLIAVPEHHPSLEFLLFGIRNSIALVMLESDVDSNGENLDIRGSAALCLH